MVMVRCRFVRSHQRIVRASFRLTGLVWMRVWWFSRRVILRWLRLSFCFLM
uniref:Uncharacterized protein n=1 Tax=Siphoviridae sp. ctkV91 TaxID=2827924 RepID=A0A8S5TDF2_9CAUD|nr:MAG TPA: hypothetical protein [Siphoviridae sp. ctkV91]